MSHELRTPLNAVIGYSQMLLEEAEDESDAESVADLERIHIAGQHLLRLVNDILDLSKIEAGKMEVFNEEIQFVGLVEEAVATVRPLAARNGNQVSLEFEPGIGIIVCDVSKTRHVLFQVLENAAKFTRDGSIHVRCSRRQTERGGQLLVSVRDTGVGIAPDQIHGLFEQFAVADDSSSSKYGGTGLGLALSQRLCHLMGGDVTAESTLNIGSCFTIMLPAVPPPGTVDSASDALAADEAGPSAAQVGPAGQVAAPLVNSTQSGHQKVLAAANA